MAGTSLAQRARYIVWLSGQQVLKMLTGYEAKIEARELALGEARGVAPGKARGRLEEKSRIALNMLKANLPTGQILALTGIKPEALHSLKLHMQVRETPPG